MFQQYFRLFSWIKTFFTYIYKLSKRNLFPALWLYPIKWLKVHKPAFKDSLGLLLEVGVDFVVYFNFFIQCG